MSTILTFPAVLKGIPRSVFNQAVAQHHADRDVKHFQHWNHLVAMIYGQLSGVTSLRGLELGFNSHYKIAKIFGNSPVRRSTLADANQRREGLVFDDVAAWLIGQVAGKHRRENAQLKYLLDSTSITLKGREFEA